MADIQKPNVIMVPIESNRPATIAPVDLEQSGFAYVKTQLENGGPLAKALAGQVVGQGSFFTALEKGADSQRAQQFRTGSFMPTVAIRKWFADYIADNWGANCELVFEDTWGRASDAARHPPDEPYFSLNGTPYYVPQGSDLYTRMLAGERETGSWYFSVYVISPSLPLPQTGSEMGEDYTEMLARNTRAVLASAYDHEGYVMWLK